MVKVGVISIDVREAMMGDDVLMVPHIGDAEHKSNVHAQAVDLPVLRPSEMTCVVEDVNSKGPPCEGQGQESMPIALVELVNLS